MSETSLDSEALSGEEMKFLSYPGRMKLTSFFAATEIYRGYKLIAKRYRGNLAVFGDVVENIVGETLGS